MEPPWWRKRLVIFILAGRHLPRAPPRGPLPYASQICAPTFLSPSLPASTLVEARDRLSSQVKELQEVLHLQKQFVQLSTELTLLQASLKETIFTPTEVSAAATSSPPAEVPGRSKNKPLGDPKPMTLVFSAITRSAGASNLAMSSDNLPPASGESAQGELPSPAKSDSEGGFGCRWRGEQK